MQVGIWEKYLSVLLALKIREMTQWLIFMGSKKIIIAYVHKGIYAEVIWQTILFDWDFKVAFPKAFK